MGPWIGSVASAEQRPKVAVIHGKVSGQVELAIAIQISNVRQRAGITEG